MRVGSPMRLRRVDAFVAATVLLFAAEIHTTEMSSASPEEVTPAGTAATDVNLVVGDQYTLNVQRGGTAKTYRGDLIKLTDRWVVLRRTTARRHNPERIFWALPQSLRAPAASHSYAIVSRSDLWIPREAATVESHRDRAVGPAEKPLPIPENLKQAHCTGTLVRGEREIDLTGNLMRFDDERLILSTVAGLQNREQKFDRADILCVSVPLCLQDGFAGDWDNCPYRD
jgi:hypothetical protein